MVRELCKAAWHEVNRFAWTSSNATVEEAAEDMAKLRERLREFNVDYI